jgi:hypothetical protein
MGDINMKKLTRRQTRRLIMREARQLEETKLGAKGEAFIQQKGGRFGSLATKAINYLLGMRFFEEMMNDVEVKLGQTVQPDVIKRVKMAMKDYIDFEIAADDIATAAVELEQAADPTAAPAMGGYSQAPMSKAAMDQAMKSSKKFAGVKPGKVGAAGMSMAAMNESLRELDRELTESLIRQSVRNALKKNRNRRR